MSILARNMKTIRKELKCTQGAMSEILNVGFRTYVRYEAGERDAPVNVLVKMARLSNVSLEQLLTQRLQSHNISPVMAERLDAPPPEVKACNLKTGTISFKAPARESLITLDESERRLLGGFRKMAPDQQAGFLKSLGQAYKVSGSAKKAVGSPRRKKEAVRAQKETEKALAAAAAIKPKPGRRKGRPGRKKLDRKSLKEKIDKLKFVTRSAPKITVR